MKKSLLLLFVFIVVAVMIWGFTRHETALAPVKEEQSGEERYTNNAHKFSVVLPEEYTVEENYVHEVSPTQRVAGVRFIVPSSIATGTNLSTDSAITIESVPQPSVCTAELFTDYPDQKPDIVTENGKTYSVIKTADAGAGNRYEESIYAIEGTDPCIAVRYFIHSTAVENYPAGTVKEFDKQKLLNEFEKIRQSLILK